MVKQFAPYGTWRSKMTPSMLAGDMRLQECLWDTQGHTIVWLEIRDGVNRLVAREGDDAPRDLTTHDLNPGGRVGYGGGTFTVHDGIVYFVADGRLWRIPIEAGLPKAITPKFGGSASPTVSYDGQWLAYIHTYEGQDTLTIVDTNGKQLPSRIAQGDDFVMQPDWHPEGTHIVYVAWNHPNMPWNGTELRLITLSYNDAGTPYTREESTLVGGDDVAILQPIFSPDGRYIAYVSDESGYGHIYFYDIEHDAHRRITRDQAEHGVPAWIQGIRQMAWTPDGKALVYIRSEEAFYSVWKFDVENNTHMRLTTLDSYKHFEQITVSADGEEIALIASASILPTRLITASITHNNAVQVIRRATTERFTTDDLSQAETISWIGDDDELVYGLFYAPLNRAYHAEGAPPLMILVHGGPTSQRPVRFDAEVQFFTSRGYAVLQINHRGSTGYGKAYMNKHAGTWGVVDVEDCVSGARYLIDNGQADKDKIIIMGGSAGGYTVLQALTDHAGFFKAGISSYGITNQFTLVMGTHKFESRYNDWLIGTLPDDAQIYRERSPLFKAHQITDAILLFQGEDDNVVPKEQADAIVSVLRRQGTPHEYHVYAGEGHGWRKPETITDFYQKIEQFLLTQVIYV